MQIEVTLTSDEMKEAVHRYLEEEKNFFPARGSILRFEKSDGTYLPVQQVKTKVTDQRPDGDDF